MAWVLPPVLLVCSNVLMIYAWYWHLKKPDWPLWLAI
ncbi:MAG: DMT family protein, partial [Elioraea sp.]|nr:DMT family protein [Elioraea sp.]